MHDCEPFTADLWICTQCGNLFARWPRCANCDTDPGLGSHECQPPYAKIEGDCEPDPVLTGGIN